VLPHKHLIIGIAVVAVLFLLFPSMGFLGAGIILASSVLIDIDHYFYYIFKKRNVNPISAYRWFRGNMKKCKRIPKEKKHEVHFGTCVFHGIEILILLSILGNLVSPIFYFILIGFALHLVSDLILEITKYNAFNKISVIYCFLKSRGMVFIDDLEDF
jgi:hypothetical protein